ncbi:hypothetical protein V5O48_017862 [Marasmius crinis-equi]|uniref:Tat pathway signal sequence n=1 Tax=Marasmius crinis-equi TaxID=585013 RepID=A0ABR3EMT3_9AGAR
MNSKEREDSYDSGSYEPLLHGNDDFGNEPRSIPNGVLHRRARRWKFERLVIYLLVATNVISLLSFFGVWMQRKPISSSEQQLLYSPANHLLEQEVVTFHSAVHNDTTEYMGPPSPEVDQAWDDLYKFGLSRIPEQEAKLIPWKTIRIPGDPTHYAVALDVFHQLHCLNVIRRGFHPNYYSKEEQWHIDHCIEHLRQAITCSSDVSLIVWKWFPEKNKTLGLSGTPHTCRNFDKIYEWAKDSEHNLPAGDFNLNLHPPHDS